MTTRTITIKSCCHCLRRVHDERTFYHYCIAAKIKYLCASFEELATLPIPSWCPLPVKEL